MNVKKKIKNIIKFIDIFTNVVEEVRTNENGELYLKLKDNLIIETNGSQLFYTENGIAIIQSKTLHLNPKVSNMEDDFKKGNIIEIGSKAIEEMKKNGCSLPNFSQGS